MNNKEQQGYIEAVEEEEYFSDVNNCAAHAQGKHAILNMPDRTAINIFLEWASNKGYAITIKYKGDRV